MKYIVLNRAYSLRNEATCSYIVRKNMFVNSNMSNYQTIYTIPPFLGYIITNIGKKKYEQSIAAIGKALDINTTALQSFIFQIVEQPSKSVPFMGEMLVFPEQLLILSNQKDDTQYFTVTDFSPMNSYVQCRPQTPLEMNFMVTEKCNTNCIYCYAKRNIRREMSTSEIANIFRKLSYSGIINLTLTGGDIFARKDWYDIISLSQYAGFGYLISTKSILEEADIVKLKQLGIPQIQFSLDSISPKVLKKIIKVGSEYVEKLKVMFEMCTKHNLNISLRTVLCKQNSNIEDIRGLCDFVNIHTCIVNWVITPAFYSQNKSDYKAYSVDNEMLKEIFLYLRKCRIRIRPLFNKLNENGYVLQRAKDVEEFVEINQVCYANTYSMSILPSGDCTICEMLYYNKHFILGNIKEMNIEDIWNSKKALSLYSPSKEEIVVESTCSSCSMFDKCRKNLAKKICYVDIMKVHKHPDLPDPKCPQSQQMCNYIL
ncbi:hypothetical protein CBG57_09240 [Prevotella nigrescens]|uniref:radical SAM/SPASM domain-containing protein n=1 Tax=Prevotella TaxID=838 RepID=UPI000B4D29ED|nr:MULTISPECIES: radical SAM protein [Prevotella]OWP28595.1 hypothetical protein CBG57_09240 [Prevotella nigrescens]QUB81746.1 radical SAM protein [Prevotella jejuni]